MSDLQLQEHGGGRVKERNRGASLFTAWARYVAKFPHAGYNELDWLSLQRILRSCQFGIVMSTFWLPSNQNQAFILFWADGKHWRRGKNSGLHLPQPGEMQQKISASVCAALSFFLHEFPSYFSKVKGDVKNSLVYLDNDAGECAKTCLDFEFWMSCGAKNVLRLEDASENDKVLVLVINYESNPRASYVFIWDTIFID